MKYIINCEECGREFPSDEQSPEILHSICPLCYEDYCVNEAFRGMDDELDMNRLFIINGRIKEAPTNLKETPQVGSLVSYCQKLYKVSDVVYYFEYNCIHIILNAN